MDTKFVKLWDWLAYSERDENTPFAKSWPVSANWWGY